MGNYISHRPSDITGKVILSDGTIHEFDHPLVVAELMLEHPQQVVVEFRSLAAGNRPTPLPADKKLEMKKVYLMLPKKRGKTATLSADEARQILMKAKSVLRSGSFLSSTRILPLFAWTRPTGIGMGHKLVFHGKDSLVEKPEKEDKAELLEIFNERPEFLSREFSGKGWKPTLDTIKEKAVKKKVSHWLL